MKSYSKLIPVLACALLAGFPAARAATDSPAPPPAQEQRPRMQQMREQCLRQLDETVHLTAEQKARIQAIWDQTAEQARTSRQNEKETRRQMRVERRERREMMRETHQKVREVLTPEQQKLFDQMPRPGRGPAAQPLPPPAGGQQ